MKELMEAIIHARKHLATGQDTEFGLRAGGLLAYGPDTPVEPYRVRLSPPNPKFFPTATLTWPPPPKQTNVQPNPLHAPNHPLPPHPPRPLRPPPPTPPLHRPLSRPLRPQNPRLPQRPRPPTLHPDRRPVCPICSTELNDLARNVPYAHHTKSYMEEDPVVLPNWRVFGRERLRVLNEKLGTRKGRVRDPTDVSALGQGQEWGEGEVRKVLFREAKVLRIHGRLSRFCSYFSGFRSSGEDWDVRGLVARY